MKNKYFYILQHGDKPAVNTIWRTLKGPEYSICHENRARNAELVVYELTEIERIPVSEYPDRLDEYRQNKEWLRSGRPMPKGVDV